MASLTQRQMVAGMDVGIKIWHEALDTISEANDYMFGMFGGDTGSKRKRLPTHVVLSRLAVDQEISSYDEFLV